MTSFLAPALWLAALLLLGAGPAAAQLISPGKLSRAHEELEGVRGCTSCHELRKPGIAPARCLECHAPLQRRVDEGTGYHARVAERGCADCHKEHFGRDFDAVRLDPAAFRHGETGYELRGGHARVDCRGCHAAERVGAGALAGFKAKPGFPERTFLGLPTTCAACHAADDPHGNQFRGRGCQACHDEGDWKKAARFDHDRTKYPLTGRHARVSCDGCHTADARGRTRFVGVDAGSCTSCHRDPHAAAMGAACTRCHSTAGWQRIDRSSFEGRFDHDRTAFPLKGLHADVDCAACHGRPARPARAAGIRLGFVRGTESFTYPRPVANACTACHLDRHEGEFRRSPGGIDCAGCHTERGWSPTTYDVERHARTAFALDGAHLVVPCAGCHGGESVRGAAGAAGGRGAAGAAAANGAAGAAGRFRVADRECRACHAAVDPHGGEFAGRSCGECHGTASFQVARFDHTQRGAATCVSCHRSDDPHQAQFGDAGCDACHGTETYRIAAFDHSRTSYPLDGAHIRVACGSCHRTEAGQDGRALVRYRPLGTACKDCHGGGR